MMQQITIGTNTYNLIAMPASPGITQVSISMSDIVAQVANPFTRQTQTFAWAGGDQWSAQIVMPAMKNQAAAPWKAFLASLQGSLNVLQLGDPDVSAPYGTAEGAPVVDMSATGTNEPMQTTLYTRGWQPSAWRLLLPGDYLQIGYRLHIVIAPVNSDVNGHAPISIWPSLRDTVTDGQQVILAQPKGLFRLGQNERGWHASPAQPTSISLNLVEVR